jgi:hypothetical protein
LISLPDDGIVVREGTTMWQTRQALEQSTDYARVDGNRWRATYRGFVSVEGVGDSPHASQYKLEREFDLAVARLVARTARGGGVAVEATSEAEPIRHPVEKRRARRAPAKMTMRRMSGKKRSI